MAKATKDAPAGQLGNWLDDVPEEVQELADAYDKAHTAKSNALGKLNTARDNLIAKMKETGCKRCPIRNGDKFLELEQDAKVRIKKPKDKQDAESNGRTALDE